MNTTNITQPKADKPEPRIDSIKVITGNGFATTSDPYQFAKVVAGDYSTKAERSALVRLFPRFLSLTIRPINWNAGDTVQAEHEALCAVAEAASTLEICSLGKKNEAVGTKIFMALQNLAAVRKQ